MAPVNPPSPDNFLLLLWIHYEKWVKSEGYGSASGISFSLSSLGRSPDAPQKGYPALSSKFKAAVVKILIIFVAVQSQQLENASDLISKVRVTNSWALAEFVHVLSGADFWLTARERQHCMHVGSLYLRTYQFLAADAQRNSQQLWYIRPKHHYFEHIKDERLAAYNTDPSPGTPITRARICFQLCFPCFAGQV